jgi:hypothetical protein
MLPWYRSRRSVSAAAKPAAPPPTITILSGSERAGAVLPFLFAAGISSLVCTKSLPSRCSTVQRETGLKAGARKAFPVRRLKQA